MAGVKSKEERELELERERELEREWWVAWRAEDYSWDGLAEKHWLGWSVAPDGAVVEREEEPEGSRPAKLQDYWRDEAPHLIEGDGKRWTRAHCPFAWADGTPTPKASWGKAEKAALETLYSAKLGKAAETSFETRFLSEWYEREPVGVDRRAQFQGTVLFGAPTHPKGEKPPLSVRFEDAFFSGDVCFRSPISSGASRFVSATFPGDPDFISLKGIDQVLEDLRIPNSQKPEVTQNLLEAIAADFLVRLGDRLSEDDKRQLTQIGERMTPGQDPDLTAVVEFFKSKFSQEELSDALFDAMESVIEEFREEMNPNNGAIFSGDAHFDRALFSGTARFINVIFSQNASFPETTFLGGARFDSATFSGEARFGRATFFGDAHFLNATFEQGATFGPDQRDAPTLGPDQPGAPTFQKKGLFGGAKFRGPAEFSRLKFQDEADFNRAAFSHRAFFEETMFLKDTTFERVIFSGLTSFSEASFCRSITFQLARFDWRASFAETKFLQNGGTGALDFNGARFSDFVDFQGAKFPSRCGQFSEAFDGALFGGVAYFRDTGLHWIAALHGATLEKTLILDQVPAKEGDEQFLHTILPGTWTQVRADVEAKVEQEQKQRGDKANASGSKAQPVTRKERKKWRRELPQQRLRELEGGCRVVKLAMGRDRNEVLEQRYYRFQLMARRHQRRRPFWEKFFSAIYWHSSGFGTALIRPILILAFVVWPAFALAYWGCSAVLSGAEIAPLSAWTEGDLRFDPDYFEALRYSASRILPSGAFGGSPHQWAQSFLAHEGVVGLLIRALASLESLIAIVLGFLFALAVRRRFQIS